MHTLISKTDVIEPKARPL